MEKRKLRVLPVLTAIAVGALAVGLLTCADAVSEGVRRGLEVCGGVLIPSLFPFMAVAGFLSATDYGRILSIPLRAVTTRVYKLPQELGFVVLLSMIGGYPVGAKLIAGLLEERRIDRATAERMLCFCVNCGPSFLITAVGAGLFLDRMAGVILFGTQTAATLLIGCFVSLRTPIPKPTLIKREPMRGADALVVAVNGAASGMFAMCAFAVLFSGLLSMVTSTGAAAWIAARLAVSENMIAALLSGVFEVTSGCIAAAKVGGQLSFGLVSAIVSFGGLSVLFQVMSCFGGARVRFRPMLLSRLAHMLVSTCMALPLHKLLCKEQPVWLAIAPPLANTDNQTILLSVCLLAMCTIFLLQVGEWGRKK